jgi:hypothetical protein
MAWRLLDSVQPNEGNCDRQIHGHQVGCSGTLKRGYCMSPRDEQEPQDFQKMCKQAERDHEARKLVVLIERVRHQLEKRERSAGRAVESPKPPVAAISARVPSRSSFFER